MATTDDIRRAFLAVASPGTSLVDALIEYAPAENARWLLETDGKTQKLKFTGWYPDGTPFAFVSAPFTGDPLERTRQIAEDLLVAHTGRRADVMSRKASGLARLMGAIKAIDADADALADELDTQAKRVQEQMAVTRTIVKTVGQAADDLQKVNAEFSNGGPTDGSA